MRLHQTVYNLVEQLVKSKKDGYDSDGERYTISFKHEQENVTEQ